jgi:hypothetical protein
MNKKFQKATVCGVLLAVSGAAVATGCPAVMDAVWQAAMVTAGTTISTGITGLVESVSSARVLNLERMQSALRVLTKQIETTSNKQSAVDLGAKQATSSVMTALYQRKAVFNTMMDFNSATAQGFDPCGEVKRSQSVAVAIGEANNDMREKVLRELDTAPGRVVKDQGAVVSQRLKDAAELYCTADEVKAGVCANKSSLAGKDVDASHFFTSFSNRSDEGAAKSALLNNLYGVPYQAPPKEAANSVAGQAFFDAKRNEDAVRSVSQASMKAIQSWTESRGTGPNASDSVLDTLSKKIGTYTGGENYKAWEVSKTSQSERGLLVEYAKMKAAELYMLNAEYQQAERIEANMATLLALQVRATPSNGDSKAQAAAAQAKVR